MGEARQQLAGADRNVFLKVAGKYEIAPHFHSSAERMVLVSAQMPGIDGFETSRRLLASVPDAKVVLLYGTTKLDRDSVADSGAMDALPLDSLTAASLQALWGEHRAG